MQQRIARGEQMPTNKVRHTGRHFLQIPGPTPLPDRVLNAMSRQMLDHRGPEFAEFGFKLLASVKTLFKTSSPVFIYPSSGTGAWESGLVNTLSPGDRILIVETGQFAVLWRNMAEKIGLKPEVIPTDWRSGADPNAIEGRLKKDKAHDVKAVCIVHNETSTGTRSSVDQVRKAIDAAQHPALFMVDTVSSLAAMDYRHDEWGVDVAIAGSQKGLMLPPGLSFTAVSQKAIAASKTAKLTRSYWSWDDMLTLNAAGTFPYTPAGGLLFGLAETIEILNEEGLDNVFARHERLAEAVRRAVRAWDLDIWCHDPKAYSPAVTAVGMPEGHNADAFRKIVLDNFDMSLGTGLNKLAGKAFRIGHLGHTNELTICGALCGVEMGLELAGVPHAKGGAAAAMAYLAETARPAKAKAA
jgi:alanine-glyoxylate transaminase/serine-glyoxylate transaminase/serine-pyruvate transaminase